MTVSERLRSAANMTTRVNAAVALLCDAAMAGANELERAESVLDQARALLQSDEVRHG